ncbi:MAG: AzlC family ABC transporter permease [Faecalibacterium sp.]
MQTFLRRAHTAAQPGVVLPALRAAAPCTLPVLTGYFVLGLGYGIYVQSLGLPVWYPMLMGTVVYGGSLEFVLASLLLGAFDPVSAFLMALMIQARHLFYGLAMLERYRGYGWRSLYMIFSMSDETFSITCSAQPPAGVDKGWFMFFISLLDQCYWVLSAGLGAVLGAALPFSTEGVDFVMTAMFVVIFLNQWEKERQHAGALIGLAAPLGCLALFGPDRFLLPAMVCILMLLLILRKPIERAENAGCTPDAQRPERPAEKNKGGADIP